jgi:hypothetical protein
LDLLLLIIGRICKDAGIETASDPIATDDHDAVRVGLQEVFIEEYRPLGVKHFPVTMRHERGVGSLPTKAFRCEGLEGVWELSIER